MLEAPGDGFVPNHRDEGEELRGQRAACPEALSGSTAQKDIPAYTQRSVHTEAPRAGLCAPSLLLQAASHPEGVGGLHPTECLPRKGNGVG